MKDRQRALKEEGRESVGEIKKGSRTVDRKKKQERCKRSYNINNY